MIDPTVSDEVQEQPEEESSHPGWQKLGEICGRNDPPFDNLFFLLGYDFSCNIYLLRGEYSTLIDPGNDYTAFMDLVRHGVELSGIKKIVLTHGHRDHAMGIFELLRAYPTAFRGGLQLILHQNGPAELKKLLGDFGCVITEVKGGEVLELSGVSWEVIHAPGHTADGICLYDAGSKSVVSGDVVLPDSMAEPDKNAGGRLEEYLIGFRTLLQKDIENVLPGHGIPAISDGKRVVEESYVSVLLKILGVKTQIPWMDGARALVARGYLPEALFCCQKELVRDARSTVGRQLKALCLNDLGRFSEALTVLDELSRVNPQAFRDPYTIIGKGYALMGLGHYDQSIRCFDEALQLRPDMQEALVYKGMALSLSGQYEAAMEIDIFKQEYAGRFKMELEKVAQVRS